jgi:hypothetical protein
MNKENKKSKKRIVNVKDIDIPTQIFLDRTLSGLEAISEHLHKNKGLTYHEIAVLLNRDDRTIWTSCHRAEIKRKETGENSQDSLESANSHREFE